MEVASSAMALGNITTAEGFREAVLYFGETLETLSVEQAAALVDEIRGGAPRAVRKFAEEDLDDLRIKVDVLRNRLRRRFKKQRSSNIYAMAGGGALTLLTGWLMKVTVLPAWGLMTLVVLGVMVSITGARALAESSDWRTDVQGPFDGVADMIAKQLAELAGVQPQPFRDSAAPRSTGVRVAGTMEPHGESSETVDSAEEVSRKARR